MGATETVTLPKDDLANPVIVALATAFRSSRLGNTGKSSRAFSVRYEKLVHQLARAGVEDELRAISILSRLAKLNVVRLKRKPLARQKILSVLIDRTAETKFFELLGETAPSRERIDTSSMLFAQQDALGNHTHAAAWKEALKEAADDIMCGRSPYGLPNDPFICQEVLRATAAVVSNAAPISLRRLGAEKLRDSKLLQRRRDSIERFMTRFLPPELANLEAWQVADEPPSVQLHGPLGVELGNGKLVGELERHSPYTISDESLSEAQRVFTSARRCISVENLATFRELAKLHSGNLLVHSSYPSVSVIRLLRLLPPSVAMFHWGDTDPWGFDILRVLRLKVGRNIGALEMAYRPGPGLTLSKRETTMLARLLGEPLLKDVRAELRAMQHAGNKGWFEQESLPLPVGFLSE